MKTDAKNQLIACQHGGVYFNATSYNAFLNATGTPDIWWM
jgi:hypothetical protein